MNTIDSIEIIYKSGKRNVKHTKYKFEDRNQSYKKDEIKDLEDKFIADIKGLEHKHFTRKFLDDLVSNIEKNFNPVPYTMTIPERKPPNETT